jgi:hypothetical protein
VTDTGDKEHVQKVSRKAKAQREYEVFQLSKLLKDYDGRAVLWRILSQCGIYQDNLFPDNHGVMARQEGKRSIGLWLLREIHAADPHAYARMGEEAVERDLRGKGPVNE